MNKIYPKNFSQFIKWTSSNLEINKLYYLKNLHNIELFDVTLRDGLQSINKKYQDKFTLKDKINLYNKIIENNPKSIEIGSIAPKKVLPIMSNTLEFYNYLESNKINNNINNDDEKITNNNDEKITNNDDEKNIINMKNNNIYNYILFPNKNKFIEIFNDEKYIDKIFNFSFITSVSNSFQYKNTKQLLSENYLEIYEILHIIECRKNDLNKNNFNIKIYISCINECPIEGKIDNDLIVNKILNFNLNNIDNICLSDTKGTLNYLDYVYIINRCKKFNMNLNKLSLHLHINPENIDNIEKIIFFSLDNNILKFDISLLEIGGCTITINKKNLYPNLTYELFYKILVKYIESKI